MVLPQLEGICSYHFGLLQSQDSLHHNLASVISVFLYIYIQSSLPQMVVEHNQRNTWTQERGDAPLGGRCGETMELQRTEPTINTPPDILRHLHGINQIWQCWLDLRYNQVRRSDTTRHWVSKKSGTESVRPQVWKGGVCIFIV
jgi:hypothetical protein